MPIMLVLFVRLLPRVTTVPGLLYDMTGSFNVPYLVGGSLQLLGAMAILSTHVLSRYRSKHLNPADRGGIGC